MPCFYCGVRLRSSGPAMRTKDHVVPKSKGGTKTVEACLRCNGKKADLSLEQFRVLCGGIEFWAERMARIEAEKVGWIYHFNIADRSMTPVDYVREETHRPININYRAAIKQNKDSSFDKLLLNSLPDLRGVQFGSFTVQ